MNTLRIFLIGAGHIARSHAKTAQKIAKMDGVELEIHVADPVEAARTSFAEQFEGARTYETAAEMLAVPSQDGDIAIVATPPFLHREGAEAALDSGRHTLVEKPLAPTQGEAEAILEAAHRNGKLFGDCSMRLHDMVSTRELGQRIREGEIGVPYHVTHIYKGGWGRPGIEYQPVSKWFLDKSKAGGGILVDWGVYDLANLTFLLRPTKVEVRHAWWARPETPADPTDVTFDVETHAGATMVWHLEDGAKVTVNYERASGTHGKAQGFSEVEGSQGAFEWTWAWNWTSSGVKRAYHEGKTAEEELKFVDEEEQKWEIEQGERPLIAFYRATRGSVSPVLVNESALFNFRVLMGLFHAAATGESVTVEKDQ
jgi:predicted dehydrogenase